MFRGVVLFAIVFSLATIAGCQWYAATSSVTKAASSVSSTITMPSLHPAIVAALQLAASLFALIALCPRGQRRDSP